MKVFAFVRSLFVHPPPAQGARVVANRANAGVPPYTRPSAGGPALGRHLDRYDPQALPVSRNRGGLQSDNDDLTPLQKWQVKQAQNNAIRQIADLQEKARHMNRVAHGLNAQRAQQPGMEHPMKRRAPLAPHLQAATASRNFGPTLHSGMSHPIESNPPGPYTRRPAAQAAPLLPLNGDRHLEGPVVGWPIRPDEHSLTPAQQGYIDRLMLNAAQHIRRLEAPGRDIVNSTLEPQRLATAAQSGRGMSLVPDKAPAAPPRRTAPIAPGRQTQPQSGAGTQGHVDKGPKRVPFSKFAQRLLTSRSVAPPSLAEQRAMAEEYWQSAAQSAMPDRRSPRSNV